MSSNKRQKEEFDQRAKIEAAPGNQRIMAALIENLAEVLKRPVKLKEKLDIEKIILMTAEHMSGFTAFTLPVANPAHAGMVNAKQDSIFATMNVKTDEFGQSGEAHTKIWETFLDAKNEAAFKSLAGNAALNLAVHEKIRP